MAAISLSTSGPKQSVACRYFFTDELGKPVPTPEPWCTSPFSPLGSAQVGGEHHFSSLLKRILDGRHGARSYPAAPVILPLSSSICNDEYTTITWIPLPVGAFVIVGDTDEEACERRSWTASWITSAIASLSVILGNLRLQFLSGMNCRDPGNQRQQERPPAGRRGGDDGASWPSAWRPWWAVLLLIGGHHPDAGGWKPRPRRLQSCSRSCCRASITSSTAWCRYWRSWHFPLRV